MTTASLPFAPTDRSLVNRVVRAGATVWVLDGLAAMTFGALVRGTFAFGAVWRGVARALLGNAARTGGAETVAFGLLLHACVAFTWTALYALAYTRLAWLRAMTRTAAGTIAAGAIWGAVVQCVMSLVVVPLSRIGPAPAYFTRAWFIMLGIHMIFVGQPMAWLVRDRRDA
jgi:hypothetical protein